MTKRDEFSLGTKRELAGRVGYLCSHPNCPIPTVGPKLGSAGIVVTGDAAHITAAAENGPRFNRLLSPADRKAANNGIWLCKIHAAQIDADDSHFTVETLAKWKAAAELAAFEAFTVGRSVMPVGLPNLVIDAQILEALGLRDPDVDALSARMRSAAIRDAESFKAQTGWPAHAIALSLRRVKSNTPSFTADACASVLQVTRELVIVAPPGTGKSTTGLQIVESVLAGSDRVAVFVLLNEWSKLGGSILASLPQRSAFFGFREQDFLFLALNGRLTLVLDGWNELDQQSKAKAIAELSRVRREYPLLELTVTTRRQALDVPLSGPQLEIENLSESQQLELARTNSGSQGESILERARRTPGLRPLLAIPLYLNALLESASVGALPNTKEEILRIFIQEHELRPANAQALEAELHGLHGVILAGLAVEATNRANTALSESSARAIVSSITTRLTNAGQISVAPQPGDVLEVLVNIHALIRLPERRIISFQHQQVLEWYASLEVAELIARSSGGDTAAKRKLHVEVLNVQNWEESILFACERLSRESAAGANAVAAAILDALTIDPILAAEMIYRSSPETWDLGRDHTLAFVRRWHRNGKVDRAVRFMLTSGRPEFADRIWPLLSNENSQIHLSALREVRQFRLSVLGGDAAERVAKLPEKVREHVLAEIALESDMDGMEFAAAMAKADSSELVQFAVLQALDFRGSDRLLKEVLRMASTGALQLLVQRGYCDDIDDSQLAAKLRAERDALTAGEGDPIRRVNMLLSRREPDPGVLKLLQSIFASKEFPIKDRNAGGTFARAMEMYPAAISTVLVERLANGLALPYGASNFLTQSPRVDSGPIRDLVLCHVPKDAAEAAAATVGPQTISELIQQYLTLKLKIAREKGKFSPEESNENFQLLDLLQRTQLSPFVEAWLSYRSTTDPQTIAFLADLLSRHGHDRQNFVLPVGDEVRDQLAEVCCQWADTLLNSSIATRLQFSQLVQAIARVGARSLADPLSRLLAEDLARWRSARAKRADPTLPRQVRLSSDAAMSYVHQYRSAFSSIGGPQVAALMNGYLLETDFGFEAACVLKNIYDERQPPPDEKPSRLNNFIDFQKASARRAAGAVNDHATSPEAETILAIVRRLLESESTEADQRLAISLAQIGFSLPHKAETVLITKLLALPFPPRSKLTAIAILVQEGTIVPADFLLEGVKAWIDSAKQQTWRAKDDKWELEHWLALFPFSDRPDALTEALDLAAGYAMPLAQSHVLLCALQHAPGDLAERILANLPLREPALIGDHSWITALVYRGTPGACLRLLDAICGHNSSHGLGSINTWAVSKAIAAVVNSKPELRVEMLRRYQDQTLTPCHSLVEHVFAQSPSISCILAMIQRFAAERRPMDSSLNSAIEKIALEERPVANWPGAHEVHSVDVSELRRDLFGLILANAQEALLAADCLTSVDELRDTHGRPDSEPRHPNISSGRPWPSV